MPCSTNTTTAIDNTPLECDEIISDKCVVHQEGIAYLSLLSGSTQYQVNNAIVLTLINNQNIITSLQNQIVALQERVEALENPE